MRLFGKVHPNLLDAYALPGLHAEGQGGTKKALSDEAGLREGGGASCFLALSTYEMRDRSLLGGCVRQSAATHEHQSFLESCIS